MDDQRIRISAASVRIVEGALAALIDEVDTDTVAPSEATELWQAFDRVERRAANAKILVAAQVEASGTWKRSGARSAAEHLAHLGGTSTAAARRALENSKSIVELPSVRDALRGGALSVIQLDSIVPASAADPSAQERLIRLAKTTNVTELKEVCLRTTAAADPDPAVTHQRIHANRFLRTYTDGEGAWNLVARGPAEAGARVETALAPFIDSCFTPSKSAAPPASREAYAFDALVALTDRSSTEGGGSARRTRKARHLALLHVDVEALTRGAVEADERCEIVGVGPVPVRVAREVLSESILQLVITKGNDVATTVHLGRGPTAAQRVALLWSKPKCSDHNCSAMFVQIDHRIPWAETRHTRLDELDPPLSTAKLAAVTTGARATSYIAMRIRPICVP